MSDEIVRLSSLANGAYVRVDGRTWVVGDNAVHPNDRDDRGWRLLIGCDVNNHGEVRAMRAGVFVELAP
jgi:hypothetical protein